MAAAGSAGTTEPSLPRATNGFDEPPNGLVNEPERLASAFSAILRGAGLVITIRRVMAFTEALRLLGAERRDSVYWAGRATLVGSPADIGLYDRAFAVFWEGREPSGIVVQLPPISVTLATDTDDEGAAPPPDDDGQPDSGPTLRVRYSDVETLRHKDFADCSDAELTELHSLMSGLRFNAVTRRSRRAVRAKRFTRRPDLRRTIRRALRTGGEAIQREFLKGDRKPRRVVLLLDVSGSMEPYARALVRFAHAAVVGRARVEAFTIGTRLTRVTRELSSRDPDAGLRDAAESVQDWSGGTRLGATLHEFNDKWGVRGHARGAIVVVVSDGWDRGTPDELEEQMARLHRVTHRLVWVNPLKHTPGYAPLARGMAAALPHVDDFIEGHSFDSLEQLAATIAA
ncbi:vWA domain-containing protein [Candidatus Poriferisodalis sp.]|uniref:vWA domain-containing protein n=1 Tax=Candidatus Poriferisodalis sp. TaxID=3101277 RepID=UPI003B524C8C